MTSDPFSKGAPSRSDVSANLTDFISSASFWLPDAMVESAWHEHAPFAFWLMDVLRPRMFVELGSHHGFSYLVFCQAAERLCLETKGYAIDTWQGDEHAGFYGNEVYERLRDYHEPHYGHFSRLVRSTFDDALEHFSDGSIDLLHIDGRHFYGDVKHDFEAWKSKLSDRAVVLFHDTNVRERGFGVFKLWAALSEQYPSFEFLHGHGLGVLGIDSHRSAKLHRLFSISSNHALAGEIRNTYYRLGKAIGDYHTGIAQAARTIEERAAKISSLETQLQQNADEAEQQLSTQRSLIEALKAVEAEKAEEIAQLEARLRLEQQKEDHSKREFTELRERFASLEGVIRESDAQIAQYKEEHRCTLRAKEDAERRLLELTIQLGDLQRKSGSSRWLLRQLGRKLAHTPRDLTRKGRHSWKKRRLTDTRPVHSNNPSSSIRWISSQRLSNTLFRANLLSLFWRLRKHPNSLRDAQLIIKSGLFDPNWYLRKYADVAAARMDPLLHYLKVGAIEGRNPSGDFDTTWYLETYPDVAREWKGNPFIHYILHGLTEGRKPVPLVSPSQLSIEQDQDQNDKSLPYEANSRIKINPIFSPYNKETKRKKRLAIFASFSPNNLIEDYVITYISELSKVVDGIIFVSDNELSSQEYLKIKDYAFASINERHGEYDFGSYKRGYEYIREQGLLVNLDELVLCNDSVVGPIKGFEQIFAEMDTRDYDFWGITESDQYSYHIQSYFICFRRNLITSNKFSSFLSLVKNEQSVSDVVIKYEIGLTTHLQKAGFRPGAFIQTRIRKYNEKEDTYYQTEHFPLLMIEKGAPVIKTKALKRANCNLEGINQTLKELSKLNPTLHKILMKDELIARYEAASNIKFSVIMATRDRAHSLTNAIDSVLQQTHQYFELIIVDDCSTDGTNELISHKYKHYIDDGTIIYIRLPTHSGVSVARNVGLSLAKNPWIAYIDSDNTIRSYYLSLFSSSIVENSSNKTFYGKFCYMNNGTVVGRSFDLEALLNGNFIDLGTFVHSRQLFLDHGGFDVDLKRLVDWDLVLKYTKISPPVFVPFVVMDYDNADKNDRISVRESAVIAKMNITKKHTNKPTITTAILSYNHKKYISNTIESALQQKGKFVHEILISDDGSTDGTSEIIDEYQNKNSLIIRSIGEKNNVGVSRNFERCFASAKGEFVAILEGDDYWIDPYKLEQQIHFLQENEDCAMVFNQIEVLDVSKNKYRLLERQKKLTRMKLDESDFLADPSMNLIANFSCCMFRTNIMKNLPGEIFYPRFNEITTAFYLARFGFIGYLDKVMSVYRQHPNGLWTGSSIDQQIITGKNIREATKTIARKEYKEIIQDIIDYKY